MKQGRNLFVAATAAEAKAAATLTSSTAAPCGVSDIEAALATVEKVAAEAVERSGREILAALQAGASFVIMTSEYVLPDKLVLTVHPDVYAWLEKATAS